jgi:hypothetical protein
MNVIEPQRNTRQTLSDVVPRNSQGGGREVNLVGQYQKNLRNQGKNYGMMNDNQSRGNYMDQDD